MTNVIHIELLRLHEVLERASSLDEMIAVHDHHLSRLQTLCFLSPNTTSVRKAVLSVLDLCLHFTEVYRAYSGGVGTVDVSHRAIRFTNSRLRRRRRINRQQRLRRENLIRFTSDALPASSDEEEEDEEHEAEILESSPEDDEGAPAHTGVSMDDMTLQTTMSISFGDIEFAERIDNLGNELDALVRYLSKHTEGLASGGAEEASTFARLAFALDDWDL